MRKVKVGAISKLIPATDSFCLFNDYLPVTSATECNFIISKRKLKKDFMDELILQLTSEYGVTENEAEGIFDTVRIYLNKNHIPYMDTSINKQEYNGRDLNKIAATIENRKEIKLIATA